MNINDKKIDAEIGTFPYFRPPNQLPFPGTKGCLLVTTSDFTLPPRIDLMKWETIESLIGVYDIEATLENNILSLYKTVNNERTKVFDIGVVTVEDKEKISKLNYVSYIMNYVDDTHTFNFIGIDKDNNQTTIFSKDIVDYQTFTNAISDLQNQINNIKDDITEINDDLIDIDTNLEDLNDFKNQYIAILQILAQATNPNLILSKDIDGVTLKWVNRYGLDDVIAEVNAVTNTITFKKVVNGVENIIITIDNFNYADYTQFKENFESIQNDLNEASIKDYILAKIDNTHYDWININNILKFSSELNLIGNEYYQLKFKMFNVDYTIKYYDKDQIDNILNNYYTKEEVDDIIETLSNSVYTKIEVNNLLLDKQNIIVPGDNITLENLPDNTTKISASGGGGDVTKTYVDQQDATLDGKITTLENNVRNSFLIFNKMKQDVLETTVSADEPTDTDYVSSVDLTYKKNKIFTFSQIMNYIRKKITEIFYPVGSVVFNTGTNPGYLFGGVWELYSTGGKALYLDSTAGEAVEEELPNIKGIITNCYWAGTLIPVPSGAFSNSDTNNYDWQGQPTETRKGMLTQLDFKASNSNSVYKDNGKVKAEGITICAWKRTA